MILSQCERVDQEEEGLSSLVKMKKELENKQVLKSKVSEVLNELEKDQRESKNTVDPDSTVVNSIHGSHTCYNVQSVVDEKHGLIVNTDVVSRNNDYSQFAEQINQATETLGKQCLIACADAGYTNIENVKKLHDRGVHVVAPSKKQASKKIQKPFDKENFQYDKEKDCYICPEGHLLEYAIINKKRRLKAYQVKDSTICRNCNHFLVCTTNQHGRSVKRYLDEESMDRLKSEYKTPSSQAIYNTMDWGQTLPDDIRL